LKRILFDSDVLLDVLTQREPFFVLSAQALNAATRSDVQGYVAGHSVTNIFYPTFSRLNRKNIISIQMKSRSEK